MDSLLMWSGLYTQFLDSPLRSDWTHPLLLAITKVKVTTSYIKLVKRHLCQSVNHILLQLLVFGRFATMFWYAMHCFSCLYWFVKPHQAIELSILSHLRGKMNLMRISMHCSKNWYHHSAHRTVDQFTGFCITSKFEYYGDISVFFREIWSK